MVGADHTGHVFSGLRPGRLYRSEVITHSGELTNSASATGRTCKTQTDVKKCAISLEMMEILCFTRSSRTAHSPVCQTGPDQ